jgi:hypothetical protein
MLLQMQDSYPKRTCRGQYPGIAYLRHPNEGLPRSDIDTPITKSKIGVCIHKHNLEGAGEAPEAHQVSPVEERFMVMFYDSARDGPFTTIRYTYVDFTQINFRLANWSTAPQALHLVPESGPNARGLVHVYLVFRPFALDDVSLFGESVVSLTARLLVVVAGVVQLVDLAVLDVEVRHDQPFWLFP